MSLQFSKVTAEDLTRVQISRSSKYDGLLDLALGLAPKEIISIPCDDEDPKKMRLNISNTIRGKVQTAWEVQGKLQILRVFNAADKTTNAPCIAISCEEVTEEQLTARKESREKRAKLMSEFHKNRKATEAVAATPKRTIRRKATQE